MALIPQGFQNSSHPHLRTGLPVSSLNHLREQAAALERRDVDLIGAGRRKDGKRFLVSENISGLALSVRNTVPRMRLRLWR
jgi:hypothetical protein